MQIKNVRFIIAAITTLSAYAAYVSRVNLSIALIAMVDDHHDAGHSEPTTAKPATQLNMSQGMDWTNGSRALPWRAGNGSDQGNVGQTMPKAESLVASSLQPEHHESIFLTSKKSVHLPLIRQEKFNWSLSEQGHILGAFFYGYILFQVPGARIAESVGAKWIIMAASAGSALISLTFPLSTQLNSIYLLMVLRFVMGLCQSAFFPAAYVLFCRWLPERERSVLLPIMFIGGNVGSISTYILSSYLISSSYGWPSVFYLSGLVCSFASLLWWIIGSSEPRDNWLITDEECQFIERNISNQSSELNSLKSSVSGSDTLSQDNVDSSTGSELSYSYDQIVEPPPPQRKLSPCVPRLSSVGLEGKRPAGDREPQLPVLAQPEPSWTKMLTSIPIWTLIFSMYGNEWSQMVICYELPTYLSTALSFPIEQNGVANSFFQLTYSLASPIMSSIGAYLLDRHCCGMRKIHVRKLFQSLATFGQMICYISVPICGANRGLIMMFMFSATIFKACANAGDIMVPGDLSPEYAGTIFAFANAMGNTAGFFMPIMAGALVNDAYQREQWTSFWLLTGAIMGCSGLVFLVFGETRRQDLSKDPSEPASELTVGPVKESPAAAFVPVEKDKLILSKTGCRALDEHLC